MVMNLVVLYGMMVGPFHHRQCQFLWPQPQIANFLFRNRIKSCTLNPITADTQSC